MSRLYVREHLSAGIWVLSLPHPFQTRSCKCWNDHLPSVFGKMPGLNNLFTFYQFHIVSVTISVKNAEFTLRFWIYYRLWTCKCSLFYLFHKTTGIKPICSDIKTNKVSKWSAESSVIWRKYYTAFLSWHNFIVKEKAVLLRQPS